jgi:outer membrane protein OmpA-like peptidoglycan-associated protein/flagellar hook assembly protein FlgD
MRNRTILFIIIVIIMVQGFCFAGGHKEKPVITVISESPQYLSPNDDGVQDTATGEFTVRIKIKSKEGYIPQYAIQVSNSDGEMINEDINKGKSDVNFFSKLFMSPGDFDVPAKISWDGKNNDGEVAPDGRYSSVLWVKDASGNVAETPLIDFVVDTTPPEVTITPEHEYFSPNGDGNQDTLIINQSGTVEPTWEGEITDADGNTMQTTSWTDAEPDEVVWDGSLPGGGSAPDGTYTYTLTGSDRAGNTATFTLDSIVLDTRETPLTLTLSSPFFSPNGDGIMDDVTIYPEIEDLNGLLTWQVSIKDPAGNTQKSFSGDGSAVEEEIIFNGMDESGEYLSDGEYQVVLEAEYNHGNNPVTSVPLAADLRPPEYNVVIENPYFSPNGDGYGDVLLISMESDEEITWTGSVLDPAGTPIRDVGVDSPATEMTWDGMDNEGTVQPEGEYSLSLTITDIAGNEAEFAGGEIYIDFTPPESYLSLNTTIFSPNGDGQKDVVSIEVNSNEPVTGNCVVKDVEGNEIQYVSVLQDMTMVQWNGTNQSGSVVPDGTYMIEGDLSDLAGNSITTEAQTVSTDTRPTRVGIDVPRGFSPNDDDINDTIVMDLSVELQEGISTWSLFIEQPPGVPAKTFSGDAEVPPSTVEWDGMNDMGQIKEGSYTAKLRVEYNKGDIAEAVSNRFTLDVSPPDIALNVKSGTVADEDPLAEELYITMEIKDESEIKEWDLDIINNDGVIIRSYSGEGDPSDDIAWNASGDNEKPVPPEDQYTIVVKVTDVQGNNRKHTEKLPLDLLIARIGDKYYLIVPNIIFGAYQYKLDSAGREMYKRNMSSIEKAAEIYKKYPQYKVKLEGHALNIYLNKGKAARDKEERRLVPLTRNRVITVQNALADKGINRDRIDVEWFGGKKPIVSVEDRKIYWKNRRVEFLLERPETEEPMGEETETNPSGNE